MSALNLYCSIGCWKMQIFDFLGYQGLPNASVIWVFYQNRSADHKKHPQALESGCWGSYHNKLAKGHFFFGTPWMFSFKIIRFSCPWYVWLHPYFPSPNQMWGDEPCKDIIEQGRALVECRSVIDQYEFAIYVLSPIIALKTNSTLTWIEYQYH